MSTVLFGLSLRITCLLIDHSICQGFSITPASPVVQEEDTELQMKGDWSGRSILLCKGTLKS